MLGNFSFGDYFKQGAVEFAWELSTQGFGFDAGRDLDHGLRRRRRARHSGPDEEAIECWRVDRRAGRADRAPRPRGQLLAVGPDRPVRAVLGALPRPRPRLRPRDDRPGDDTERFLEFWNLVFMQYELHADGSLTAAAQAEHRHRHGARPHGGDPPGRGVGLRDRPLPAADPAGRGAVGARVRRGRLRHHAGAADPRRPRPRGAPSCSPTAWCPRTRTAATSCAGSCAARSSRAACSASRSRSCRGSASA